MAVARIERRQQLVLRNCMNEQDVHVYIVKEVEHMS
jgi:hypothetical protein